MAKFRDIKTLQKFSSVHASIHNHFNFDRHLNRRAIFKQNRSAAWSSGVRWLPETRPLRLSKTGWHCSDKALAGYSKLYADGLLKTHVISGATHAFDLFTWRGFPSDFRYYLGHFLSPYRAATKEARHIAAEFLDEVMWYAVASTGPLGRWEPASGPASPTRSAEAVAESEETYS